MWPHSSWGTKQILKQRLAHKVFTMPLAFMHFFRLTAAFFVVVLAQSVGAVTPFKVEDIRVEGLQRVEAGTVFGSIPVRVGDTYSDDKAAASIKSLFSLGLFNDVRIEVAGQVLIVGGQLLS